MALCAELTAGIALDCDNPIVPGVESDFTIINKSDIDAITYNATNKNIVESITLKAGGKAAYRIEGKNDSAEPTFTLVKTRYQDQFDHQIRFKVFSNLAAQKLVLDKIAKGKYVVIYKNEDQQFEVLGIQVGLICTEMTRNPLDTETGGAYDVLLKTSDNTGKEPRIPATFFITDEATTEAAVTALLTPTV